MMCEAVRARDVCTVGSRVARRSGPSADSNQRAPGVQDVRPINTPTFPPHVAECNGQVRPVRDEAGCTLKPNPAMGNVETGPLSPLASLLFQA